MNIGQHYENNVDRNSRHYFHNVVKIAGFSRLWGRIMKIMLTEILPSGKAEMFTTLCYQNYVKFQLGFRLQLLASERIKQISLNLSNW